MPHCNHCILFIWEICKPWSSGGSRGVCRRAVCSTLAKLPGPRQGLNLALTIPALRKKAPFIALLEYRHPPPPPTRPQNTLPFQIESRKSIRYVECRTILKWSGKRVLISLIMLCVTLSLFLIISYRKGLFMPLIRPPDIRPPPRL